MVLSIGISITSLIHCQIIWKANCPPYSTYLILVLRSLQDTINVSIRVMLFYNKFPLGMHQYYTAIWFDIWYVRYSALIHGDIRVVSVHNMFPLGKDQYYTAIGYDLRYACHSALIHGDLCMFPSAIPSSALDICGGYLDNLKFKAAGIGCPMVAT